MIGHFTLAGRELINYAMDMAKVSIGQVYDSGSSFFVVTSVEMKGRLILVTGDIHDDDSILVGNIMGIGAMMALWPTLYLSSVFDSHTWGAFYREKLGKDSPKALA